jgi:hypothetical protein
VDARDGAELHDVPRRLAVQGAYVVWLPLEIAIIHRRTAGTGRQSLLTRRAAAVLVGALVDATSMNVLLALPAVAVTLCLFAIWFGVEDVPGEATGGFDWTGLALVTAALGLVMAGLVVVRLDGPGSLPVWLLILAGVAAVVPFARYEDARRDPIVDVRLMRSPGQWPVQLTAFLFGMSVLGAQIPLSTFARTDPAVAGYGLGADASFVSILVGLYVVFLAIGAFTLPVTSRLLGPRGALVLSALLVALGYASLVALQRLHRSGAGQHGRRRPRLGGTGRRAAGHPRGRGATGAHRLRHRHDQRDQDGRRRDRLRDLRDRPGLHRLDRRPRGGARPAGRLPHRLVDLRDRRTPGRRGPADPPQAARRAPGQLDRSA